MSYGPCTGIPGSCCAPGGTTGWQLDRIFEPDSFRKGPSGRVQHRNKFRRYAHGKPVPKAELVTRIDKLYPGTAADFNHILWTILRHRCGTVPAHEWLRHLAPDVQRCVLGTVQGTLHTVYWRPPVVSDVRRIQEQPTLDVLACFTSLYLEEFVNKTEGSWCYFFLKKIYQSLLALGPDLEERGILTAVLDLYEERIFTRDGNCMRYTIDQTAFMSVMRALHKIAGEIAMDARSHSIRDNARIQLFCVLADLFGTRHPLKLYKALGPDIMIFDDASAVDGETLKRYESEQSKLQVERTKLFLLAGGSV